MPPHDPPDSGPTNATPAWRRGLRYLRHLPDRLLHPARRTVARARIRGLRDPGRLLFVCLGNICRSPYAEHALRRRLPKGDAARRSIVSGGFVGPGRPSPPEALEAGGTRGVDLSGHRSRLLTAEAVARSDLILVMEPAQGSRLRELFGPSARPTIVLGDLDPMAIERRAILDPFGREPEVFSRVYDRIDRCLTTLVESLEAPEPVPDPASGLLPDPLES